MKKIVLFVGLFFWPITTAAQDVNSLFTLEILVNTCATVLSNQAGEVVDVSPAATARSDALLPKIKEGIAPEIIINPGWKPTEYVRRRFYKKHKRWLPDYIPPGHKDNALGKLAIVFSHDVISGKTLKAHDTNEPKSIGKRSSSGCVRKKYEDIFRITSLLYASEKSIPIELAQEELKKIIQSKKTVRVRFENIKISVVFLAS